MNHLNYNDTILNSKSYVYIDNIVLNEKIKKNLACFNKYICNFLNIPVIENLDLNQRTTEKEKMIKVKKNINYIKSHKEFFQISSKINHKKIIELLENPGKKQPSIMEIAKKLDVKYITLYRYVRYVLRYHYLKSNRLNNKSRSMQVNYQTIYFCDFFSMAYREIIMFLINATSATFFGFPIFIICLYFSFRYASCCDATNAIIYSALHA